MACSASILLTLTSSLILSTISNSYKASFFPCKWYMLFKLSTISNSIFYPNDTCYLIYIFSSILSTISSSYKAFFLSGKKSVFNPNDTCYFNYLLSSNSQIFLSIFSNSIWTLLCRPSSGLLRCWMLWSKCIFSKSLK